jgi:hypothetical protein
MSNDNDNLNPTPVEGSDQPITTHTVSTQDNNIPPSQEVDFFEELAAELILTTAQVIHARLKNPAGVPIPEIKNLPVIEEDQEG